MITLEWIHVQGTQEERPAEVDLSNAKQSSLSPIGYVYLRKNIQRIEVTDPVTGETTEVWDYDEAILTRADYGIYAAEQAQANLDYLACMTDVDLDI